MLTRHSLGFGSAIVGKEGVTKYLEIVLKSSTNAFGKPLISSRVFGIFCFGIFLS